MGSPFLLSACPLNITISRGACKKKKKNTDNSSISRYKRVDLHFSAFVCLLPPKFSNNNYLINKSLNQQDIIYYLTPILSLSLQNTRPLFLFRNF